MHASQGLLLDCVMNVPPNLVVASVSPKNIDATCAAAVAKDGQHVDMEWIADAGSAQDLISKADLGNLRSYTAPHRINIITANGPSSADGQADAKVPSLGVSSTPYVLHSAPSVLTVGYRCMEEGFDFIWRAYQRPYFRDPKGNKTYRDVRDFVPYLKSRKETYTDVRDFVPYLKSRKEGTAVPARRKPEPPIPASYAQDIQDSSKSEGSEVVTKQNVEIINDEMTSEPPGSEVCCEEMASSAEAGARVVATPAHLRDESMSLHDLMTRDPDPPAPKAKPKPKAKAKPKAEAKPNAASKAPRAKAKSKSESSKTAKDKTASAGDLP